MSVSGINFSGLASGIDTDSIIKQLLTLDQRPIDLLKTRVQQVQQRQTAVNQVAASIAGFQAAATALDLSTSFSVVQANSTDDTVVTATADPGAQVGNHSLQVTQLAQAQRIGSTASIASQTSALGASGQIVVNGKAINVASSDSLQAIASNINSAQAGVNASIISPSTGSYMLVLSSTRTGSANAISLSDTAGGTILSTTLGLIGAASSVRHAITNGAASDLFSDSATSIGTLIGLTAPQSGTVQINGTNVSIDFATDSLTSIAGKINTASIAGVTASVIATTDPNTGASRQQLQIVGASTPTFTDANNVLANLGIVQKAASSTLAAAKDATFQLDGIGITRSSNTVTDVISGVTLNLLKDSGSPSAIIDISTDTKTIKKNIQGFVDQYNQIVKTIGNLAQYDPQTQQGGPLFGDVTISSALDSITSVLTDAVPGLSGTKTLLAQIGIKLDNTGQLNITDADLDSALQSNLSDVARIFHATGVASDSSIAFITASEKTKASSSTGYAVNISQLATQASALAGTAHTADNNPDSEILTFTGAQFGSGKTIILNPNTSLDGIVSQINADTAIGAAITASNVGGKLQLTGKAYGSKYGFTVVSSQPAAANNSGIGNTAITAAGLDVAGTINGEAATGDGQFLTGTSGNKNTDGLMIRVTSTTTGAKGSITFTQGIAAQSRYFGTSATDAITGSLTQYSQSMDTQVQDLNDQISSLQDRLKDEETRLRQQFAAMEDSVTKIKAASAGLASLGSH